MATWTGFSDSELRSMKQNKQEQQKKKDAHVERRPEKTRKSTTQQVDRVKSEGHISAPQQVSSSVPSPSCSSSSTRNLPEAVPAEPSDGSSRVVIVEESKNNIASSEGQPAAWSSSTNEGASISFERSVIEMVQTSLDLLMTTVLNLSNYSSQIAASLLSIPLFLCNVTT